MLFLKILTLSCTIILFIVKESIFVVNVCKLLAHDKCWNVILIIALKLMVNERLKIWICSIYYERKIKSLFMIYPDFESILVPGNNEKQNLNKSYANRYQKHVACSFFVRS